MPSREILWNIQGYWVAYVVCAIALVVCFLGFRRIFKLVKDESSGWLPVKDRLAALKDTLRYAVFQRRILDAPYAGLMHVCICLGLLVLLIATIVVAITYYFHVPLFQGDFYLGMKFAANLFGLVAFVGVLLALIRRCITKPEHLRRTKGDVFPLVLLLLIIITGFLVQSIRMQATHDQWAAYGFVGYALMPLFSGLDENALVAVHRRIWWIHFLMVMGLAAYLPFSKLAHIILAPINIIRKRQGAIGVADPIDFEDENIEVYGKNSLGDCDGQTLFGAEACVQCGRCEANCPAFASGKGLNPLAVLQNMKSGITTRASEDGESGTGLAGVIATDDDIWSCTTCRACEANCPVFVGHVDKIIEMRRYLVLTEGSVPRDAQEAFQGLETNGNPWGLYWGDRSKSLVEMGYRQVDKVQDGETVFWPGCMGAFDDRGKQVSAAVLKLFQAAGVDAVVLGDEVKCCGDSARRMGNEFLFEQLARDNIEAMNAAGVKRIVTSCPHCLHTLKEEYPQFGGKFEVLHHSQFLRQLLDEGRLQIDEKARKGTVTYHDPCYLGRYHDEFDAARVLLKQAGFRIDEMPHNRKKSFCCGAGGGRMWLEEEPDKRVNAIRVQEALGTGADCLVTGCSYCLNMLSDGVKDCYDGDYEVVDFAELLAREIAPSKIQKSKAPTA